MGDCAACRDGSLRTSSLKVADLEIARTGLTETEARKAGLRVKSAMATGTDRPGICPNPHRITIKLVYEANTRQVLGAQAWGEKNVSARINAIAVAIRAGMTVEALGQVDFVYSSSSCSIWGRCRSSAVRHSKRRVNTWQNASTPSRPAFLARVPSVFWNGASENGHPPCFAGDECFLYDSGAAARVGQVLSDAGVEYAVYYNVQPNPTVQVVNDCIAAARTLQVQLLVALGGGSAIDTAKAASIVVACGGTVEQYEGENKSSKPGLPIVAVNTTAGTGSECTSFYIVTDPVRHSKWPWCTPTAWSASR